MKKLFKELKFWPLFLSGLIGAVWGVVLHIFLDSVGEVYPIAPWLFLPLLFGGINSFAVSFAESRVLAAKPFVLGLVAGFVYLITSGVFPFLASALAGLCLASAWARPPWARSHGVGMMAKLRKLLRGSIVVPICVLLGSLIPQSIDQSLHWVAWGIAWGAAWGGLFGIAIGIIHSPYGAMLKPAPNPKNQGSHDLVKELNEIAQDVGRILRSVQGKSG